MLRRYFTDHPAEMGETYVEHLAMALGFSGRMFKGALVCLVHAFVPCFFVRRGSGIIDRLHQQMVMDRALRRASNENPAPPGRSKEGMEG